MSRPQIPDDEHRTRLLEGMARAVTACGYAEITTSDIVREANVSKRTFYQFFKDKSECLIALFNHSAQRIEATLRASIDPQGDWSSQIDRTIQIYLETLAANPVLLRTLFVEILALGAAGLSARRIAMEKIAAVLLEAAAYQRENQIPQWLSTSLIGGVNEMVLQHIEQDQIALLPQLSGNAAAFMKNTIQIFTHEGAPRGSKPRGTVRARR